MEKNATTIRKHLGIAGVERTELVEGTDDHARLDFRSLRTTGITCHARMETDSCALARYAGHRSPDITWSAYAKEGPDRRRRDGEPFPALDALIKPMKGSAGSGRVSAFRPPRSNDSVRLLCEGGDLNPYGVTR